jgi:hypothetical protein
MIQRRIFTQLHDGLITCSCTAGDRIAKLIQFFNDAGFVFNTPTSCLNIFFVTASVRHKHRCPLLDAHPHPSSAAQPGASASARMLETRALPGRASSPSLSPSFPPFSVSTRSHRPYTPYNSPGWPHPSVTPLGQGNLAHNCLSEIGTCKSITQKKAYRCGIVRTIPGEDR